MATAVLRRRSSGSPAFSALRQVAAADFDGDGKLDVAATIGASPPNQARFVGVFRGNGDGTFAPGPTSRGDARGRKRRHDGRGW